MSPALADFLFEAANFLILAAILGRLLFKPVRTAIDAERERREAQEKEAERVQRESDSLQEKARLSRQAAEREAEETRKNIVAEAKAQAEELLAKAREAQQRERRALDDELAAKRGAQADALADAIGRLAAEAVQRLMESLSGPSLDTALLRAASEELGALATDSGTSAMVESARALDDEQRAILKSALGGGFEERVVPELGAGVRVTTAAGQVDATATSIARTAGRGARDVASRASVGGEEEGAVDA